MRSLTVLLHAFSLTLLLCVLSAQASPLPAPVNKQHLVPRMNYGAPYKLSGTIFRVIDGDTFIVNVNGEQNYRHLKAEAQRGNAKQIKDRLRYFNDTHRAIRVRVDFIDTPESVHLDQKRNTQAGLNASAFLKNIAEKKQVNLTCYGFGRYGRVTCSASLGERDIGLIMLREGYATYTRRFRIHPTLDREYLNAEKQGKRK